MNAKRLEDKDMQKFVVSRDDSIYEAWPDVALCDSGRLVCVFSECDHHGDRNNARIAYVTSDNRGRFWSAGGMMAYPVNAPDVEFTGTVMEALSAGSAKYLKEAFINKYIEGKVLRDRDSVTVYRMMRELATYDFSYNIDPSGKLTNNGQYRQFNQKQNADVASWWAENKEAIQKAYDELYAQVTG